MREITMEQMVYVVEGILKRKGLDNFGSNHKSIVRYFAKYLGSNEEYCRRWDLIPLGKPDKGLFLYGGTGSGKTTFMEVIEEKIDLQFYNVLDMERAFRVDKNGSFEEQYNDGAVRNKDLILDDLGADSNVTNYGNKDMIQNYIMQRYDLFRRLSVKTHFTSNVASVSEIGERYGERVLSRIREMCYMVKLDASDRRYV